MSKNNAERSLEGRYIPIAEPDLSEAETEAVLSVLRSGWLTRGQECLAFEAEFGEWCQAEHCLYLNSCTAALHLALLVNGIGASDQVILPALTFAATGHTIVQTGAQPVFAEIDPDTLCLDPNSILEHLTSETRAVVVVHFGGYPADLNALRGICEQHNLILIEDAAHALGTCSGNTPVGGGGSTAAFSFYTNKNLTTVDGGMLCLPTEEQRQQAEILSLHGLETGAWNRFGTTSHWRYAVQEVGYKYNGNDLLAALGRAQLRRLEGFQQRREHLFDLYSQLLGALDPFLICPSKPVGGKHGYHLYAIRLRLEWAPQRDNLVGYLREHGIGATVHYDPLHLHPAFKRVCKTHKGQLPVTESAAEGLLSLPLYPGLTETDIDRVVDLLHCFFEQDCLT